MSELCGERPPDSGETPREGNVSLGWELVLGCMELMGATAGLTRRAGTRTGDALVAAGRGVGKLLKSPSKLWSGGERRTKKRRTRALRPVVEPSQVGALQSEKELLIADCGLRIADSAAELNPQSTIHNPQSSDPRVGRPVASDPRVGRLEADLAAARRELEETRNKAEEVQARHLTQVSALQSEKELLLSNLRDAQVEAEGAEARADALVASDPRVGRLEADLAAARRESAETRNKAEEAQARHTTQISALQSEKESLLSNLRDAQARAEDAISRAEELDAELSQLRGAIKSATSDNEELRSFLEQERSSQRVESEVRGQKSKVEGPKPTSDAGPSTFDLGPSTLEKETAIADGIAPMVTAEEARAADFSGAAERVIFTRALSNIWSDEAATRVAAVKAMGAIRHELSVRALIARFGREASAEVRQECLCALTALDAAEAIPVAQGALRDEAASVRLAAVRAIYRLVGLEGVDVLAAMLHDKDEDVRRRVATCLGWLGHEPLAFKLVSLLRDASASVRLATLEALGNLKSPAVVDDIIELLDDPEESVQKAAFHALETITGKQMGKRFPQDQDGRRFLIARWRAWREKNQGAQWAQSHLEEAAMATAFA